MTQFALTTIFSIRYRLLRYAPTNILNYPGFDAHLVTCVRPVGRHRVERSSRLRVRPAGAGRGGA